MVQVTPSRQGGAGCLRTEWLIWMNRPVSGLIAGHVGATGPAEEHTALRCHRAPSHLQQRVPGRATTPLSAHGPSQTLLEGGKEEQGEGCTGSSME